MKAQIHRDHKGRPNLVIMTVDRSELRTARAAAKALRRTLHRRALRRVPVIVVERSSMHVEVR